MEHILLLIVIGFVIGTIGTLIGAGGGFILVPLLILMYPKFTPEVITAISMAVVASNSISGSVTYMATRRVDYRAGVIFAICTIPGSILGVLTTAIIPRNIFDFIFGIVLVGLALFLFMKGGKGKVSAKPQKTRKGWVQQRKIDKWGHEYVYAYDLRLGSVLSVFVGYFSPLLGIGGGIIHVPVMVEWLRFPVHIATATSHFILAIMATVSVAVHVWQGAYNDPTVLNMVFGLIVGVVPGAQFGAYLSGKIKGKFIVKALAVSLGVVGIRILLNRFGM